jgi:hypothetical protein
MVMDEKEDNALSEPEKLFELWNKKRVLEEKIARLGGNAYSHLLSPNAKIRWAKGADEVLERLDVFGRDPIPRFSEASVHLPVVATTGIRGPSLRASGSAEGNTAAARAQLPLRRRPSERTVREWYTKRVASYDRAGTQPSREQDYQDAKAELGEGVTHDQIESLRGELAPRWTRPGRRAKKTGQK